jgi:hypothetical protein
MLQAIICKFKNFRDQIFGCFSHRADATMALVDTLAGNSEARSVVQLSLNPTFRRGYGSIRDAIGAFDKDPGQRTRVEECLIRHCSPTTRSRPYHLFVLDCTAAPRKYAKTVKDRGVVHAPNVIPGNKPITVGHQYSMVGFLPEQSSSCENIPWMLPLSVRRVATDSNGISVGIEQLDTVLPSFGTELVVTLGDTAYSTPKFIQGNNKHENAILIARLRGDRVLNHKAAPKVLKQTNRRTPGHELWYGDEFNFKDATTWGEPSEIVSTIFTTRKGKKFTAHIEGWNDILMRQKKGIPLNEYPLRIIRITITDEDGNSVYKRPMWLMVSGKRRQELSLIQIWLSYKRRYDIEHFFKFGKMQLLMDKFQTPETAHEESWWQIASLAYAQLYMARELAKNLPNPWEKYLPEMKNNATVKSARQVQKSFTRLTQEIGTPASAPKLRGKPLGRQKGAKQPRRNCHPIILKRSKPLQKKVA